MNQNRASQVNEIYNESMRYISNAVSILREKGKQQDGFYTDKKYIRMACHTAYVGTLEALRHLIKIPKSQRMDILVYRNYLTKENKKILHELDHCYGVLHLYGGYDGFGKKSTIKEGLDSAVNIIHWVKTRL